MKTVRFQGFDCMVEKHHYENGRPALVLTCEGEQVAVATLNMPEIPIGPNTVIIKDYSENEGMLKALVEAGVIENSNVRAAGGFPIGHLKEPYLEKDSLQINMDVDKHFVARFDMEDPEL
jgi:hypothetical protein